LWFLSGKINAVKSASALRWDCPDFALAGFLYNSQSRDCPTPLFSNVHDSLLEVGAGLRDNENAPCIVANPAMFSSESICGDTQGLSWYLLLLLITPSH